VQRGGNHSRHHRRQLIGPSGRNLTDVRLAETISTGLSLSERGMLYRRTLAMIHDFPLFGVGMGAWGELFTRYVSPPWSQFFYYRETHNDYLPHSASFVPRNPGQA
jgi:hypothetical protein